MGLIIPKYESDTGLILENAYACPVNIYYDDITKSMNFQLAIYANEQSYYNYKKPVDSDRFMGILGLIYDGSQNLIDKIDEAILLKANNVHDKTDEEIALHNHDLQFIDASDSWINTWDPEFNCFYGAYKSKMQPSGSEL